MDKIIKNKGFAILLIIIPIGAAVMALAGGVGYKYFEEKTIKNNALNFLKKDFEINKEKYQFPMMRINSGPDFSEPVLIDNNQILIKENYKISFNQDIIENFDEIPFEVSVILKKSGGLLKGYDFEMDKADFQFKPGEKQKDTVKIFLFGLIFDFFEKYYDKNNKYPLITNSKNNCDQLDLVLLAKDFGLDPDLIKYFGLNSEENKNEYEYQYEVDAIGASYVLRTIIDNPVNMPNYIDPYKNDVLGCSCSKENELCVYETNEFLDSQYQSLISGMEYYRDGKYKEALKDFQKASAIFPDDPDIPFYVGLTYLQLNEPEKAIEYFKRALAKDPEYTDVHFQLGVILIQKKAYQDSIAHLERVYEKEPTREDLGYFLGFAYYQTGEYKKALSYLEKAKTKDKTIESLTFYYMGLAKHQLEQFKEAITAYKQSIAVDPNSPLATAAKKLIKMSEIENEENLSNFINFNWSQFIGMSDLNNVINFSFPEEWEEFLYWGGSRGQLDGIVPYINIYHYRNLDHLFRLSLVGDENNVQAVDNLFVRNIDDVLNKFMENGSYRKQIVIDRSFVNFKIASGETAYLVNRTMPSFMPYPNIVTAFIFNGHSNYPIIEISFSDKGINLMYEISGKQITPSSELSEKDMDNLLLYSESLKIFKKIIESIRIKK